MATSVDLNADLGEGYGPWEMGDDAALMAVITSANVACGGHAGDPDVMARAMQMCIPQSRLCPVVSPPLLRVTVTASSLRVMVHYGEWGVDTHWE